MKSHCSIIITKQIYFNACALRARVRTRSSVFLMRFNCELKINRVESLYTNKQDGHHFHHSLNMKFNSYKQIQQHRRDVNTICMGGLLLDLLDILKSLTIYAVNNVTIDRCVYDSRRLHWFLTIFVPRKLIHRHYSSHLSGDSN